MFWTTSAVTRLELGLNYVKSLGVAAGLVLCGLAASIASGGTAVPNPGSGAASGVLSGPQVVRKLAKINPGATTKPQVRSLLGEPWRTVQYNDMEELADEIWEYRGADSHGPYRIHIEFDHQDVVHIVAKIPESPVGAKGTAAAAAPDKSTRTP
jgi:hypothetical protein